MGVEREGLHLVDVYSLIEDIEFDSDGTDIVVERSVRRR